MMKIVKRIIIAQTDNISGVIVVMVLDIEKIYIVIVVILVLKRIVRKGNVWDSLINKVDALVTKKRGVQIIAVV